MFSGGILRYLEEISPSLSAADVLEYLVDAPLVEADGYIDSIVSARQLLGI